MPNLLHLSTGNLFLVVWRSNTQFPVVSSTIAPSGQHFRKQLTSLQSSDRLKQLRIARPRPVGEKMVYSLNLQNNLGRKLTVLSKRGWKYLVNYVIISIRLTNEKVNAVLARSDILGVLRKVQLPIVQDDEEIRVIDDLCTLILGTLDVRGGVDVPVALVRHAPV